MGVDWCLRVNEGNEGDFLRYLTECMLLCVCVNCCVLVFFVRRTEPEMRKNSPHYYR